MAGVELLNAQNGPPEMVVQRLLERVVVQSALLDELVRDDADDDEGATPGEVAASSALPPVSNLDEAHIPVEEAFAAAQQEATRILTAMRVAVDGLEGEVVALRADVAASVSMQELSAREAAWQADMEEARSAWQQAQLARETELKRVAEDDRARAVAEAKEAERNKAAEALAQAAADAATSKQAAVQGKTPPCTAAPAAFQ